MKKARNTITDDLFIRGKIKEKTSPSPSAYKADKVWLKNLKHEREIGNYYQSGDRITFTDVVIAETEHNPPPGKYNAFRSFTDMRPKGPGEVRKLMFPKVSARKVEKSPSSADYEVDVADKK